MAEALFFFLPLQTLKIHLLRLKYFSCCDLAVDRLDLSPLVKQSIDS